MFDTMTITKAAAALCGTLLVLLLGKWAAEGIYHMESHGEASYVIEVEEAEDTAAVAEVSFEELMASAASPSSQPASQPASRIYRM